VSWLHVKHLYGETLGAGHRLPLRRRAARKGWGTGENIEGPFGSWKRIQHALRGIRWFYWQLSCHVDLPESLVCTPSGPPHVFVDTAGWHSRSVFSSRYLQTFPEISASVEGEQFAGRGEQEEHNSRCWRASTWS